MKEPAQDGLLAFILNISWVSLAAYVGAVAIAYIHDVIALRFQKLRRSPKKIYHYKKKYRDEILLAIREGFRFSSNVTACVAYVYSTYRRSVPPQVTILNRVLGTFFTIDLFWQMIKKRSSVLYMLSISRFLQVFSLPSLFVAQGPKQFLHFGYLRAFLASDSIIRLERNLRKDGTKRKLAFRLSFQLSALFFVLAAGIQMLEAPKDILGEKLKSIWDTVDNWSFFTSVWFVIVTLSTVGYGDLSPNTIQGRMYTIFIIVAGIIAYKNASTFLEEKSKQEQGEVRYVRQSHRRHVIVFGTPTLDELVHFIRVFYADSNHSNRDSAIVMLVEHAKWDDDDWNRLLSRNNFLKENIMYIVGDLDKSDSLQRAGLYSADAVFILSSPSYDKGHEKEYQSNKQKYDYSQKDEQTVRIALTVRNFRTDVPIFCQTLYGDSNEPVQMAMRTPARKIGEQPMFFRGKKNGASKYVPVHDSLKIFEKYSLSTSNSEVENKIHSYEESQTSMKHLDIHRSKHVCLRQLSTAFLVANIKSNGVGTLCTNLYFESGVADRSSGLPWITEYQMGASCSFLSALIPETLDGALISDIASILYRRGITIVGTQREQELKIKTVLNTRIALKRGEVGIFVSYLSPKHLCAALYIVGNEYSQGKKITLCETFRNKHRKTAFRAKSPALQAISSDSSTILSLNLNPRPRFHVLKGMNSVRFIETDQTQLALIEELKNHVIIAFDAKYHLDSLSYFLKLLWYDEDQPHDNISPIDSVVVIHPEKAYKPSCNNSLFFIKGSAANKQTWMDANIDSARAVVTMSSYTNQWRFSDGNTIRTLLTLDAMTNPKHNLFICSELVDERSLEFLREPTHTRRKGARLGRTKIHRSYTFSANLNRLDYNSDTESVMTALGSDDLFDDFYDVTEPSPTIQHSKEEYSATDKMLSISKRILRSSGPSYDVRADRTFLFSRVRYTSGELLVYSTADALLVREYSQPGFVDFITGLCGASDTHPGQKIILVNIPDSIFNQFTPVEDKKRFVEYGVIFEALVKLGVTPLGIYRSGDAYVKIPKKKRAFRGEKFYAEAMNILGLESTEEGFYNSYFCRFLRRCWFKKDDASEKAAPRDNVFNYNRKRSYNLDNGIRVRNSGTLDTDSKPISSARKNTMSGPHQKYSSTLFKASGNVLPYVFTMPDPETYVAETDAIYVLCDHSYELPANW